MRIILVEDHPWVAIALAHLLTELPSAEIVARLNSESQALDWLMHNSAAWDTAVVDLSLGDGSGLRVLSTCRVRQPYQKIVVLSNHLDAETKRRCLTLGADAVFKKDSDVDELFRYFQSWAATPLEVGQA